MGRGVRAEIVEQWRTGAAALLRSSPLPRPSRWMWTADAILAFVLAACTAGAAYSRGGTTAPAPPVLVPTPPLLPVPDKVPAAPFPPVGVAQHLETVQPWQLALAALTALPLVVRRRFPLSSFWAVIVASLLFNQRPGGGDPTLYTFLSCVVAAYSAAVYSPHRARTLIGLVAGAGLLAAYHEENFPSFTPGLVPFLVLLGVGLGANAVHTWKQRLRVLREEHEAATRLAVDRERSRIARELHDIVTHNVSVMVIQAGAARKVMDTAPERARGALLAVEAGGRTAMAELRHVMGLLTMADDGPDPAAEADLAPQPGLGQVPALTDRMRETGVPVELTVTGTPALLPAGADLAAYRVVQEALTNTVKHAVGARVRIAIDHVPGAVHIEVSDTGGTGEAPAGRGGGHGLIGLRERLAVYGGTLQAGERPTGGFRVRAVIPVAVEETA
ncbi:sensor histidine kinase [Streptomyces yaanensis]|uniref:histidine kinase n=1 Tax=Streptomyces yaanensis TaxID=1142239 RepID=A0ABV7SEB5_9ACTN|nr:histidine kinase [Streptomyces sp. CGMCC 4.7035]WNB98566.1 histidine kinase [Streptomyces sp. CGMCC 4.7035]